MGTEIHTIVRNGKRIYRLWSTTADDYASDEISSEEELREALLQEALHEAKFNFELNFPRRLERTHNNGTSSCVHTRQRMDDWDDKKER